MSASIPKRDVPSTVRAEVLAIGRCEYCADVLVPLQVEHQVPLSRGGTNDRSNLVASCVSCNSQKRGMHLHEWRAYRRTHGMPWPPVASHPVDLDHYRDICAGCAKIRDAACRAVNWPDGRELEPYLICTPYDADLRRGQFHYRCPLGHNWNTFYAIQKGYFSDCECAYCETAREDFGDETYPRPAAYSENSEGHVLMVELMSMGLKW